MSNALKVTPTSNDVATGVRDTGAVAVALADVLADTYRLTFKSHAYHWNVEGPLFFSIHNLTEGQYEDMFAAADDIAERIRALGHLAPASLKKILSDSVVEDQDDLPDAGKMCHDLAEDHTRVAHRLHALIKLAGDHNDPVTEDLATERSAFHEKAAWMLRAISKS